jgi:hypothetical protein
MAVTVAPPKGAQVPHEGYARLEERILARDQVGASEVFYGLVQEGRPLGEMLQQAVRIHAPYTHVPYHQRLDDGVAKFVNNDHCLLSARTTLRLNCMVAPELQSLPLAQTVWYIPTGLDPWNQLIGKAPGHYTRMYAIDVDAEPPLQRDPRLEALEVGVIRDQEEIADLLVAGIDAELVRERLEDADALERKLDLRLG